MARKYGKSAWEVNTEVTVSIQTEGSKMAGTSDKRWKEVLILVTERDKSLIRYVYDEKTCWSIGC
jgi:hypothetical protein